MIKYGEQLDYLSLEEEQEPDDEYERCCEGHESTDKRPVQDRTKSGAVGAGSEVDIVTRPCLKPKWSIPLVWIRPTRFDNEAEGLLGLWWRQGVIRPKGWVIKDENWIVRVRTAVDEPMNSCSVIVTQYEQTFWRHCNRNRAGSQHRLCDADTGRVVVIEDDRLSAVQVHSYHVEINPGDGQVAKRHRRIVRPVDRLPELTLEPGAKPLDSKQRLRCEWQEAKEETPPNAFQAVGSSSL